MERGGTRAGELAPTRGALPRAGGGVHFSVWAPRSRSVVVELLAPDGGVREQPLEPLCDGVHAGLAAQACAGDDYRLRLDDGRAWPDPVSRRQPHGVHGPSRVVDPAGFPWTDAAWRGVPRHALVTYELHVGTFSQAGTFAGVVPHLAALAELGVTAIELMPVASFPGRRNWGYDGVFPYAPQESYGGPDGLRGLVDAAHAAGLAVLLDVVYNHLGPEGNVLPAFGPYFSARHRTPWGAGFDFDGPAAPEVRRYFVDNARHWIAEYHLDGLRLDAVHAILDESEPGFLAELAAAVDGWSEKLGRTLHLVAESDANDPALVRERAQGGAGLHAVWSDDFHHALHAALTGERDGYYADFGGRAEVARSFGEPFVRGGRPSVHRGRPHGAPATGIPSDRFVVFAQNHDQIGNRAFGERLSALLEPPAQRLATALVLLSPYLPLLFMGEEYGETRPFQYFVDHGTRELAAAVREGRRREFADFARERELPDPSDPATFERSRLAHEQAATPAGAARRALVRDLLALRRSEPALRPGAARRAARLVGDALRVCYEAGDGAALCAFFQLAGEPGRAPLPPGRWRARLRSEAAAYGGALVCDARGGACEGWVALHPFEAALYAAEAR